MSGTIIGSIDHKGSTSFADGMQEQFKILFDFLEDMASAGHCTRVALQLGAGGTGTDFWDGAFPFGENAFAVYTFGSGFDLLIQWSFTDSFGMAPGSPGKIGGAAGAGVGIAVAAREDASSPWGGTVANDGTDAKSTPVWTPGTSVLHVIDRACSPKVPVGDFSTDSENLLRATESSTFNMRMHCVGDEDGIVILNSRDDDGNYNCFVCGAYQPRDGVVPDLPLYALAQYGIPGTFWATGILNLYGTTAGTHVIREGGILGRLASDLVAEAAIAVKFTDLLNATLQPNQQVSTPELDALAPLLVYGNGSRYGYPGQLDGNILQVVLSPTNHAVNAAATRAYLSVTTANTFRWSIPWDGGAAPGAGGTRAGRQF